MTSYLKNEKYLFKVKGSRRSGSTLYYIINVNGVEDYVKAYEFQKSNQPQEITCICKGCNAMGEPSFMQDIATLLAQLYAVGDVAEFKVKANQSGRGYIEVVDENDFCFRLTEYNNERLFPGQKVRCRVLYMNRVRVDLELVRHDSNEGLPLYSFDTLLELDATKGDFAYYKNIFENDNCFEEARRLLSAGNPLWVRTAFQTVDSNLEGWILKGVPGISQFIDSFISICVNLMEGTYFFQQASEVDKHFHHSSLSAIIEKAEDFRDVCSIHERDESARFVTKTFDSLSLSGFLYQPERRMRKVKVLLQLLGIQSCHGVERIFSLIKLKHDDISFMNLYGGFFKAILKDHISLLAGKGDYGSDEWNGTYSKHLVEALAMELLLTAGDPLTVTEKAIYRSMLYRYASQLAHTNSNVESLTYKAFDALFGQPSEALDFTWNDLDNINLLCSKLAIHRSDRIPGKDVKVYHGRDVTVRINGTSLELMPRNLGEDAVGVIPAGIFAPTGMQIYLPENPDEKFDWNTPSLPELHQHWSEIERCLFKANEKKTLKRTGKHHPEPGEEVLVRVTGMAADSIYDFNCRIEDPIYEGEGTFNPSKHLASYTVKAKPSDFADPESGRQYLLRAVVEREVKPGVYEFNMRRLVARFNSETLDTSSPFTVQITRVDERQFLCIGEFGVTFFIQRDNCGAQLHHGDFVDVKIDRIYPDGNISVSVIGEPTTIFSRIEAFRRLVEDYAQGELYDSASGEDAGDMADEVPINAEYMHELIRVTDRKGMLRDDNISAFNYLTLARLLSMLLDDSEGVAYYTHRRELLEALWQFGDNGVIDASIVNGLFDSNRQVMNRYPDIAEKLALLRIANLLGDVEQNENLWNIHSGRKNADDCIASVCAENEQVRRVAGIALAYNLLEKCGVYGLQHDLKNKIYNILSIDIKDNEPDGKVSIAAENTITEFKTSLIYPADNRMSANERKQINVILRTVCSFMNASGGTLYIGVSDSGVPVGLDDDFIYLCGGVRDYDTVKARDVFDRRVRDNIHGHMGVVANSCVNASFTIVDGKTIYKMDITPAPEIVRVDGTAYIRQGSSVHTVTDEELSLIKR